MVQRGLCSENPLGWCARMRHLFCLPSYVNNWFQLILNCNVIKASLTTESVAHWWLGHQERGKVLLFCRGLWKGDIQPFAGFSHVPALTPTLDASEHFKEVWYFLSQFSSVVTLQTAPHANDESIPGNFRLQKSSRKHYWFLNWIFT